MRSSARLATGCLLTLLSGTLAVSCGDDSDSSNSGGAGGQGGSSSNQPPMADAGPNQSIKVGQVVTLDGRGSVDPDGQLVSFQWRSEGEVFATTRTAAFSASSPGSYSIQLSVVDELGAGATDDLVVDVTAQGDNARPVAVAGHPHDEHDVRVGEETYLSGSASTDADGDPLSYRWTVTSQPDGSQASVDPSGADFRITPDVEGDYVVELVVSDGTVDSEPSVITLDARAAATPQSLYSKLVSFGLDSHDAHQIADHYEAVGTQVVALDAPVFGDVALSDDVYAASDDPDGDVFNDPTMTDWTPSTRNRFAKVFGRLKFIVNTQQFADVFNASASLLDAQFQGQPPAVPFPQDFNGLASDISSAITAGDGYKFFLSGQTSGVAWGIAGLRLKVERIGMMGDASPSVAAWDVNGAAGLVFHELMHTVGYAHDGTPAKLVNLKPNNVPYLVQIIVSYESTDILRNYCAGNPSCPDPRIPAGGPNGLFSTYFGEN